MKNNYDGRYRRKTYRELEFTDDFMFRKVLRHNEKLCKDLVELLLDIKVDHIRYKDDDHTIDPSPDAKGVRLDVYLDDEDNNVFDLEMQNLRMASLPKRTRYYQSMIDFEHLSAGDQYDKLPDSYIVFICMFDPYEKGLHKYEFRELCRQDASLELGGGTSKVFINAKSKETDMSAEMRSFLDYLCGMDARSGLTREIDYDVERAKSYRPWEVEYMQWNEIISIAEQDAHIRGHKAGLEEGRKAGLEEGRKIGLEEGVREGVEEMARVNSYLLAQERYDDLRKATEDVSYREIIMAEIKAAEEK